MNQRTSINLFNKKVFLRERKRHTARRVASARYAALCNGGGGDGVLPGHGVPPRHEVPPWTWGTPKTWGTSPRWGTPLRWDTPYPDLRWGTLHLDLGWGTPLPRPGMGYPLPRPEMGYPPDLGRGTPHPDLRWGTPYLNLGWGTPPSKVEQTHTCENITSRRTYVRGNEHFTNKKVLLRECRGIPHAAQQVLAVLLCLMEGGSYLP